MKKTIKLLDLDCANCASKVEKAISKIDDVSAVSVSFLTQKMVLEAPDEKFDSVLKEARRLIKKLTPEVTVVA